MKLNVSHLFGKTNQVVRFFNEYDCWMEDEDIAKMTASDRLHESLYNTSFIPNGDLIQVINDPNLPYGRRVYQNWLSNPQQFGVSFANPKEWFYLDGMIKYDVEKGCIADPDPKFFPFELFVRSNPRHYDQGWPTLSTKCTYLAFI